MWHPYYIDALAVRFYDADHDGADIEDHYYLHDANFNVTAVVDNTGSVLERYHYTPYGEVTFLDSAFATAGSSSTIGNNYLYTGRERDSETGLQINRNRYYHAQLGRWLTRDPIGYRGGGANLYQYVGSMSTRFVDPVGEYALWPPSQWWPWGPPPPPPPGGGSQECCDPSEEAATELCKLLGEGLAGQCSDLPGAAGACAQLAQCALEIANAKKSCDEMDELKDKCEDFARKPDHSKCMDCCKGMFDSVPAAGMGAYYKCLGICAPWAGK